MNDYPKVFPLDIEVTFDGEFYHAVMGHCGPAWVQAGDDKIEGIARTEAMARGFLLKALGDEIVTNERAKRSTDAEVGG